MKTHKVRAILVKSSSGTIYSCDNSSPIMKLTEHTYSEAQLELQCYKLVLVSLQNEKIEVGDKYVVELFYVNGKSRGFVLEHCISVNGVWINKEDITSIRHIDNCKKVIATQDQLSEEQIIKLIHEHNSGGMEDFEIEMERKEPNPQTISKEYDEDDVVYEPKLTNGFVTFIKKNDCVYSEQEVKDLVFRAYNLRTADGEVRSTESLNEWFNKNK